MYATVHLLIGNIDKYLKGACISAKSFRKYGNKNIQHVIMTTEIRPELYKYFDKIYIIKELKYPTLVQNMKRYGSWLNICYTKWESLRLIEYEKILFCDADILAVKDYTQVFDFRPPGLVIYKPEYKNDTYNNIKTNTILLKEDIIDDSLSYVDHVFTKENKLKLFNHDLIVEKINYTARSLMNASFVLLKPSMILYRKYIKFLDKLSKNKTEPIQCLTTATQDEDTLSRFLLTQYNTITVLGKEYLYGGIIENFDSIIKPWNKKKEDMTERELLWIT